MIFLAFLLLGLGNVSAQIDAGQKKIQEKIEQDGSTTPELVKTCGDYQKVTRMTLALREALKDVPRTAISRPANARSSQTGPIPFTIKIVNETGYSNPVFGSLDPVLEMVEGELDAAGICATITLDPVQGNWSPPSSSTALTSKNTKRWEERAIGHIGAETNGDIHLIEVFFSSGNSDAVSGIASYVDLNPDGFDVRLYQITVDGDLELGTGMTQLERLGRVVGHELVHLLMDTGHSVDIQNQPNDYTADCSQAIMGGDSLLMVNLVPCMGDSTTQGEHNSAILMFNGRYGGTGDCSSVNCVTGASIDSQPVGGDYCEGDSVTVACVPNDDGGITLYEWYHDDIKNMMSTDSLLILDPIGLSDAGDWFCKITTDCGEVFTDTVTITVNSLRDWYPDSDGDGFGSSQGQVRSCTQPVGYLSSMNDCDDTNPNINPDASEVCNGLDDNCNISIDEGIPTTTYFADVDGDGFGDPNSRKDTCAAPLGYVTNDQDCDDNQKDINPNITEICDNGIDDDCDGDIDEEDSDCSNSFGPCDERTIAVDFTGNVVALSITINGAVVSGNLTAENYIQIVEGTITAESHLKIQPCPDNFLDEQSAESRTSNEIILHEFNIYPNPFVETVSIDVKFNAILSIYNSVGQRIEGINIKPGNNQITVDGPTGMYHFSLQPINRNGIPIGELDTRTAIKVR